MSRGQAGGRQVMGWREWLALPHLGVAAIKVKVDTGARTSALHAFDVGLTRRRGVLMVRFKVHPLQRDTHTTVQAEAPVLGRRLVKSSAGHEHERYVIETPVQFMGRSWPIELTLATRDTMGFRMILGRQAVRGLFTVDPGRSYLAGRPPRDMRRPTRFVKKRISP